MTDNVAILQGFTLEIRASNVFHCLYLLIKPSADLDSRFRAWDTDAQEFIILSGWLFNFEEVSE